MISRSIGMMIVSKRNDLSATLVTLFPRVANNRYYDAEQIDPRVIIHSVVGIARNEFCILKKNIVLDLNRDKL